LAGRGEAEQGSSPIPEPERERFVPRRADGRAFWRVLYEYLLAVAPGEVIPYADLLALLEMDTSAKPLLYASMSRALRELRKSDAKREVATLRGVGYRVLHANEHITKAELHKDRAERQLKIANDVIDATDLAALTSSERDLWSQVKRGMVLLYAAVSTHELALSRHEELIHSLQERVDTLEQSPP
jgi:DNA-binding winged helix-turn-helix (wHTH) protein